MVSYAVERRLATGKADYWDHATRLELAVLAKDEAAARRALASALAMVRENWEPETTANNLRLIRSAREHRGEEVPWAATIEQALLRRAADQRQPDAGRHLATVAMAAKGMHEKKFGAFLSHAHADKAAVDRLYAWLSDVAGVQVWYDALNMPPGSEISSFLPAAILGSRACILILSESSIRSGWVKKEHGVAEKHQTTFPAFRILPVRIDDVDDPLGLVDIVVSGIDARHGELTPETATALLTGLYYNNANLELGRARDIYVSRGWRPGEDAAAEQVCRLLVAAGFRLIGDSEDQEGWTRPGCTASSRAAEA